MGSLTLLKKFACTLWGNPRKQIVFWNIVGSHGKKIHAVDPVAEPLSPPVLFVVKLHGPQADALGQGIGFLPFFAQPDGKLIQRLAAKPVRPPKLWVVHADKPVVCQELLIAMGISQLDFHLCTTALPDIDLDPNLSLLVFLGDMAVQDPRTGNSQ